MSKSGPDPQGYILCAATQCDFSEGIAGTGKWPRPPV